MKKVLSILLGFLLMAAKVTAKSLGYVALVVAYPFCQLMLQVAMFGQRYGKGSRVGLARGALSSEHGAVSSIGVMYIGIAMIFLAVGFIIYPIVLDGVEEITGWTATDNTSLTYGNIREFTGLSAVAGITPLIVLIGFVASAVINGMLGVRTIKGSGSGKFDATATMMQGIGMIFIAIGLIIFPVIMDGVVTALQASAAATTTFTGLDSILKVTPLICLVGFIAAGIITQYFGSKKAMG